MENDRQQCADQVFETIEYGQLSREETEKRLNQIIEEELSGPVDADYDAAKVELCNSLLWQLQTHGKIESQSPSDIAKANIKRDFAARKRKTTRVRRFICAAAAILVVFLGLTALDVISPIQWFTIKPINDEQQFLIEGHSISVDVIDKAIAEHLMAERTSLSTNEYSELIDFLGFDPEMPLSIAANYEAVQYEAHVRNRSIRISCQYGEDPSIVLFLTMYRDVDQAHAQYEQDQEGVCIYVNGFQIYKYTNNDRVNYLWINNAAIYRLTSSNSSVLNDELMQSLLLSSPPPDESSLISDEIEVEFLHNTVRHEISTGQIAEAIAEHESAGNMTLTTSDSDELASFLGFDPCLPDSLDAVYFPIRYDAHIDPQSIRINAQYQQVNETRSDAPWVSIRLTLFASLEEARVSYEQNAEGEFIDVGNINVYRYTNTWISNYLWFEDHALVKLLTSLPFAEADKYVAEVIEWRNNP